MFVKCRGDNDELAEFVPKPEPIVGENPDAPATSPVTPETPATDAVVMSDTAKITTGLASTTQQWLGPVAVEDIVMATTVMMGMMVLVSATIETFPVNETGDPKAVMVLTPRIILMRTISI